MHDLKHGDEFIDRERIYDQLSAEDEYAKGWGDRKTSLSPAFPAHCVAASTGQPFSMIEWINFAEKYLNEAKLAHVSYCPDGMRAIRIRVLKAASLLVTCLQVHGHRSDDEDIAGVSSHKYPVTSGGLQAMKIAESARCSCPFVAPCPIHSRRA